MGLEVPTILDPCTDEWLDPGLLFFRIVREFGSYLVFEQLGVGGMASVHRAERHSGGTRKRVALKRLLPNAAFDPELVDGFLREAAIVKQLRHRNIAELYEFGRVGDIYYLAMELVGGPTLKDLLRRTSERVGLMPYPIAIKLLAQICDGLAHAHELRDSRGRRMGVVHRDISPSNVVISKNGVVKLIDFGIVKTVGSHTQTGIIKGKLGYIAPEYIDGAIDHRADLWAVGVIAWEMLTGRRLFRGDDDLAVLQAVMSQPIDPPSVHNPDVPPELDAIVMTALHRDPGSRWQNAAAMSTALLGVGHVSTNPQLVEWVDWTMTLPETLSRPPRGSRPLPAMKAQKLVIAPPAPPPVVLRAVAPTIAMRASMTQIVRRKQSQRDTVVALTATACLVVALVALLVTV